MNCTTWLTWKSDICTTQSGRSIGNCLILVIIRTIQGTPTDTGGMIGNLNIGAGIVYDSDPEAEWEETMAKGRAIERVLNEHKP